MTWGDVIGGLLGGLIAGGACIAVAAALAVQARRHLAARGRRSR